MAVKKIEESDEEEIGRRKLQASEKINILCQVIVALSSVIGVGGGLAYYIDAVLHAGLGYIILVEIIYLLILGIIISLIWHKIK